ncbi:hypothetical protein P8624_12285 [Flavobacteriaceae bacterium YJPT1-3]|nr:hypothetical protein P8624_12285 [Flavobacteriaceae bacterium YJPT1-3]
MENKKAVKLLDKIIEDVNRNGIVTNTLVADLKELRPYTVEEQLPLLAKTVRLIYEHVEEYETFAIGMPEEEPVVDEEGNVIADVEPVESDPESSLVYLLTLMKNIDNQANEEEVREYVSALQDY